MPDDAEKLNVEEIAEASLIAGQPGWMDAVHGSILRNRTRDERYEAWLAAGASCPFLEFCLT